MRWILLLICTLMVIIGVRQAIKGSADDGFGDYDGKNGGGEESNNAVQEAFSYFIEKLFAGKGVTIFNAKVTGAERQAAIPYSDGNFMFDKLSYSISYDENSEVLNGMNLSAKELISAAGITDNLLALYFVGADGIPCDATIVAEKKAKALGFAQFIAHRYAQMVTKTPLEEYALKVGDEMICLWKNLKGEMNIPNVNRKREVLDNNEAAKGHFKDTYVSEDIEIHSWVQFERKSELVEKIIGKSPNAVTMRGIHVGSTVEQLKETYAVNLSYLSDFGGEGPAYGYIPEDGSQAYIAFRVLDGLIIEIIIEDSSLRPFLPKEGYVEQDIPWNLVEYSDKTTDAYARELYLGRHNDDMDPAIVLDRFLKKTFSGGSIFDSGIWKDTENTDENLYYAIWENDRKDTRVYMDAILKRIKITNYANDASIWVVSKYKVQEKRK